MSADRNTADALVRAFRQMGGILRGNLRPIDGCTPSETIMLYVLRKATGGKPEGIKASELSHFLRIAPPTVTQQVNVLEARGLVERTADPGDRRVVLVRLTEEGRRLTEIAEHEMHESMQGVIDHLGADRALLLIELLNETIQYFSEKNGINDSCPRPGFKPNE